MKKLVLAAIALTLSVSIAYSQQKNLYVHNDSNDETGCTYAITPLIAWCGLPFPMHYFVWEGNTIYLEPGEDHTFYEFLLLDLLPLGYKYVGAEVQCYYQNIEVYDYYYGDYTEHTEDEGDCDAGTVDIVYTNYYTTDYAELYVEDNH